MQTKYGIVFNKEDITYNLKRLTNQVYKLLPNREEGTDWEKPLGTIIEEFIGMNRVFGGQSPIFFSLICKLEGLFEFTEDKDFEQYRRTIFECLGMINSLVQICQSTI